MALNYTLFYNDYSICSVMARFTIASADTLEVSS